MTLGEIWTIGPNLAASLEAGLGEIGRNWPEIWDEVRRH